MIYKTCKRFAIGSFMLLSTSAVATAATNYDNPFVSLRLGEEYYSLGGGKVMPPPTSSITSYTVSANFKAYLGYSCGEFNLQENIEAQFNNIVENLEGIPDQLMNAFTGAVGSMPMYLLKKSSPSLYGLINKKYDEYFDIFQMSYKSCEDIEAEIAEKDVAGGYNPYKDLMRISVANGWWETAKNDPNGETIEKQEKRIEKEAAKTGIPWIEGDKYGGEDQPPINFNSDILIAGYNYRIGRDNYADKSAPTGDKAKHRVVKMWRTPELAADWMKNTVGDSKISLADPTPKTTPGIGVQKEIDELTEAIGQAILKAVVSDDYSDLGQYSYPMPVNASIVKALRQMPESESQILVDRMASEMAIGIVQTKVIMTKELLRSGLYNPDVNASSLASAAHKHINEVSIPVLNEILEDVQKESTLKQRSYNVTALEILRHNQLRLDNSATTRTPAPAENAPVINGAVQKNY